MVYATYYGNKSNLVEITPVAAEPLTLELKASATTIHPGDSGVAVLSGKSARGPVELAPDQIAFKSSADKVVAIDPKSGSYHAVAPGEATVTGSFASAKEPATLRFTVSDAESPHGQRPTQVRIESDQGTAVKFPVGAVFDDFRVEARYADGYTRVVTKKATITAEDPQQSPVAVENGRLRGIRPGQTQLRAAFEGVEAKDPLAVEVTAAVDADELRVEPVPLVLLPGETVPFSAVGYKKGKSIGSLTELGHIQWQSTDPKIARLDGANLTGAAIGKCEVTASLGSIHSQPAAVSVVESIADELKLSSPSIKLRVGESVQIGRELTISRAGRDISSQCAVTSAVPAVVEYLPESHRCWCCAGVSTVTFAAGDKLGHRTGRRYRRRGCRSTASCRSSRPSYNARARPGSAATGFRRRARWQPDRRQLACVAYKCRSGNGQNHRRPCSRCRRQRLLPPPCRAEGARPRPR